MIDAKRQIRICVDFIRHYFEMNGTPETKAVIGISGGKDSTVAAALLVRALGKDRVVGVMMPQDYQNDLDDAYKVCETLGIEHHVINIGATCESLYAAFASNSGYELTNQIRTNAPSRIRMNVLYMVAAAVGGRVCNTGNSSEAFIGYTTKYGDLAGDFALLRPFTVREVYAIGDALEELPYELVHKAPADGMSGKTDEENIGISYDVIDDHLLYGAIPEDFTTWQKMCVLNTRNMHKQDAVRLPAPHRESGFLHNLTHIVERV